MYRNEVNERSPMRVFENTIHGGLGRGNLGVVAANRGVGKTPFLVHIALDNLLRARRVLHISHEHAVDHVRAFYSEIFHDLSETARLVEPLAVKLDLERNRLIFSLMAGAKRGSRQDGSSLERILEVIAFGREVAHFEPDVIVVDGFDLMDGSDDALRTLHRLARDMGVELWLSAHVGGLPAAGPGALPAPLDRFAELLGVVVYLAPERDVVRVKLLKDHDDLSFVELPLHLDPHTLRVIDEDLRPSAERPRDPRRFRLVSGGSRGAEAEFGACAERWGMAEVNFSYSGHRYLERTRGVVVLDEEQLKQGDFSLVYVSRRLNRTLTKIPFVRNVLQTIWHQITTARQVFAVGAIQDDGTVRGGTGWGVELARLWNKPLFVFDQGKRAWFRWSGSAWEIANQPIISSEAFAGIGTQTLTEDGREAIRGLFQRSFGDPSG